MEPHDETDRERDSDREPLVLALDSPIFGNDELLFLICCLLIDDVNVLVLWDRDNDFHPVLARWDLVELRRFDDLWVLVMSRTYCFKTDGSPDILMEDGGGIWREAMLIMEVQKVQKIRVHYEI